MKKYHRALRIVAPSILAFVGTTAVVIPHTLLLDKLTEMTQSYRHGMGVAVSPNAQRLLFEAKTDLVSDETLQREHGVSRDSLNNIKPYAVFGFDMFRLGVFKTEFGARIGIPEYFQHVGQQFSTKRIQVNNAPVKWSTPEGQKLRESFIISDEAKKFAIARELLGLHQHEVEKKTCIVVGNLALPLMFAQGITDRLQLMSGPMLQRVIIYGMVATVAGAMYVMMKDSLKVQLERRVDSALCSLSDSYRLGGLEYYSSLQQRNIALRSLLGEYGPKVYTALGNDQTLIRMKGVTIVERIEFFQKEVAKRKEEDEKVEKISAIHES